MTAPSQPTKRSSFIVNVLKLVSGTTLAQAITIITAPILSRLFAPEEFGVLNVFTSLVGIVAIVICLRYEFAIVLPEDDADAANLFVLCLVIASGISGLAGLGVLVFGHPLVELLKTPGLAAFLWLIPAGLLIQGVFQALNYWNSRTKHFGRLSIARVAASLTTSLLPMALAFAGLANASGLIYSWLAGTLIFTCVLGGQVLKDSGALLLRKVQRTRLIANLKRYRKFPLVDAWGGFINNLSWHLPSLMLVYFFSETVVGHYSLSSRLILLPMTLLGQSIAQVYYQRAAELRANPLDLSRSVEMVFRRLTAIGLFPAVVLGIAGPELFSIVFGAEWAEAGRYAQMLSPWMFVLFISSPLSTLFATLERQELALIVHAAILGTRFAALAIGGLTQNINTTLLIWSGSGVLVYGGLALWLLKLTQVPWAAALRAILRYGLYASLPALLLALARHILAPYAVWLVCVTAVISLSYYAMVIAKDDNLRAYALAFIPKRTSHTG